MPNLPRVLPADKPRHKPYNEWVEKKTLIQAFWGIKFFWEHSKKSQRRQETGESRFKCFVRLLWNDDFKKCAKWYAHIIRNFLGWDKVFEQDELVIPNQRLGWVIYEEVAVVVIDSSVMEMISLSETNDKQTTHNSID